MRNRPSVSSVLPLPEAGAARISPPPCVIPAATRCGTAGQRPPIRGDLFRRIAARHQLVPVPPQRSRVESEHSRRCGAYRFTYPVAEMRRGRAVAGARPVRQEIYRQCRIVAEGPRFFRAERTVHCVRKRHFYPVPATTAGRPARIDPY